MPDENDIVYTTYSLDVEALFRGIASLFGNGAVQASEITSWLSTLWTIYTLLAFIVSALLIFGTVKAYLTISEYSAKFNESLESAHALWEQLHNGNQSGNARWQGVQQYVSSGQPNDWKLAVIEADIMLGEALDAAGYIGTSIGEQLKSATQLNALQDAWEAHRLRNRVAHEGSDFVLTQSAAQHAVVQFERALRELRAI